MKKKQGILILIVYIGFSFHLKAQPRNLIFNGDFEQWDTSKYPMADLGDTRLCIDYNGVLNNERIGAWCVKNVECVQWLNYGSFWGKYRTQASPGGVIPCAYKICYPQEFLNEFPNDLPLKGSETFLGFSYSYDTVKNKYNGGKFFFNMRLAEPLKKGKTYRLDFDICTGFSPYIESTTCPRNTSLFLGTTGFGFGFTVDSPDYIQDPVTYESRLTPTYKMGYFNDSSWTSNHFYFTADSAFKYLVFGFFDLPKVSFDYRHPSCNYYSGEKFATYWLDNLNLIEIENDFLPDDTSLCIGDSIFVKLKSSKPLYWQVNSLNVPSKMSGYGFKPRLGLTTIVVSDSIVTDTMRIIVANKPAFSVIQTDTLCDQKNVFVVNPASYKYFWQPEGYTGTKVTLIGNSLKSVIAKDANGCTDTFKFMPFSSSDTCELGSFWIPNSFSPNDDNSNDEFKVFGKDIMYVHMQIFNLWGEKLYENKGLSVFWDGTYNNNACQQGTYLYSILIKDKLGRKHYFKGLVDLIR